MPRCWIGLGGNLGDVRAALRKALAALNRPGLRVVQASRLFETTPISSEHGARYLNAAAELEVSLSPDRVLDELQSIEAVAGRERHTRWGSRTLDLDLLLYEDLISSTPRLTLPHPSMWYRRFVLDPLAEIAAEVVHPRFGRRIQQLRQKLLQSPLPVGFQGEERWAACLRTRLEFEFEGQIRWESDTARAAMIFRLAGDAPSSAADAPHVVELSANADEADSLAGLVLSAALDEPIPVD